MTCQIETETDHAYYALIDLAIDKHMHNTAMQRQLVMVAHLHV